MRQRIKALLLISIFMVLSSNMELSSNISNYIPTYFLNSSKLIESNHRQMLYNWINFGNPRTHLLWRGSENQFNWTNIHKNIDNWGSLLLIIKSKGGFLFGGFISEGLDISSKSEIYTKDRSAFIFSLSKGTVHYQRNKTNPIIFNSK